MGAFQHVSHRIETCMRHEVGVLQLSVQEMVSPVGYMLQLGAPSLQVFHFWGAVLYCLESLYEGKNMAICDKRGLLGAVLCKHSSLSGFLTYPPGAAGLEDPAAHPVRRAGPLSVARRRLRLGARGGAEAAG